MIIYKSDQAEEGAKKASEEVKGVITTLKGEVTDDASLVEQAGYKVKLYMGAYDNIKVTTPDDLALAKLIWEKHGGK